MIGKRLLPLLTLMLMAGAANAEWTRISSNEKYIQYVDKATIQRDGNLVRMWGLSDYKTVGRSIGGKEKWSVKDYSEYDCKRKQHRPVNLVDFSGRMGSGAVLFENNPDTEWMRILSGSSGELLLVIACGNAPSLSKESENLAWCEGVYLYYAQGMQIRNNEGAAQNLLLRASRVTTANMYMNLKDGVVSGGVIDQWKAARVGLKQQFDSDPDKWMVELSKCDSTTNSVIQTVRERRIIWDKKTFDQFQDGIFATYRNSLGIK